MSDLSRPRLIDTHVHYWEPARTEWYPQLAPNTTGSFLGDDLSRMTIQYNEDVYLQDAGSWPVDGIVHVSGTMNGRAYLDELDWLSEIAPQLKIPTALIGAVDPALGMAEVAADLDRQMETKLFRGVRVVSGLDYTSTDASELLRMLAERDLIFDLVTHPEDMTQTAAALERFPESQYVVEHTGWPWNEGIDDPDYFALWQTGMTTLSAVSERVYCKLSGLPMSMHDIDVRRMRPWIEHCLSTFGPARCVIGSNFPVDRLYGDFDTLMSVYAELTEPLGLYDQQAVFGGNAARIYRIAA
jgi:L-fuconolactonase